MMDGMRFSLVAWMGLAVVVSSVVIGAQSNCVLVEAEGFSSHGGWVVDQQFMEQMGSPFLLAHGLGRPVADATITVTFERGGRYHAWVRTRNWVGQWKVQGAPGQFEVIVNGRKLGPTFGVEGAAWHWQDGGTVDVQRGDVELALHDLTGFEGRCDAIAFCSDLDFQPPNEGKVMTNWRRTLSGISDEPEDAGQYDLVVVGGGIAGTCASLNAARLGLKVALIQDRPVLGGNNSSEVRVWLGGNTNFEPYPRIGDVVAELEPARRAHYGPSNTAELYEDERRLELVRGQENLSLFLWRRANDVEVTGNSIKAVIAQNVLTGQRERFGGRLFADCTGDGCIGYLAGADCDMTLNGHMGRCNLWNAIDTGEPTAFPRCPWAVNLYGKPFPKELEQLGAWFWEAGFYQDPFERSEYIRDLNFRAMYGAWDALKNNLGMYPNHKLNWAAYVSGKRESRRLLGDVVLTKADIVNAVQYRDGCVPATWNIDLHLPDMRYERSFAGDEFLSKAYYTEYKKPYWVPYRCLYSRNVENLFMAGRDISVTHEALGAVRVMRTCGMMGEVVGMAASVCVKQNIGPRGAYTQHLDELLALMKKGLTPGPLEQVGPNLAMQAKISVSGNHDAKTYPTSNINDGRFSLRDNSLRWLSDASGKPTWVEFRWEAPQEVAAMRIVSGWFNGAAAADPVSDFALQYYDAGQWLTVEGAEVTGNSRVDLVRKFPAVRASRMRVVITKTQMDIARIWEIALFGSDRQ